MAKKKKSAKKANPAKAAKKSAKKKVIVKKKAAVKKVVAKNVVAKKKPAVKKAAKKGSSRKGFSAQREKVDTVVFEPTGLGARSGGQSGDLQGLSGRERANSESVNELLEEGNSFEAEFVKGVEDAGDEDEAEVHTHEVPQDDVPGEYEGDGSNDSDR
jgi:hypothetical protein